METNKPFTRNRLTEQLLTEDMRPQKVYVFIDSERLEVVRTSDIREFIGKRINSTPGHLARFIARVDEVGSGMVKQYTLINMTHFGLDIFNAGTVIPT